MVWSHVEVVSGVEDEGRVFASDAHLRQSGACSSKAFGLGVFELAETTDRVIPLCMLDG
jgi:hypothetical protein